jgi:hypothetical protein
MTLLEVLLATVLLGVLMTGLLAVVADVARTRAALPSVRRDLSDPAGRAPVAGAGVVAAWAAWLSNDLLHTREVDLSRSGVIELTGHAALDERGERSHLPARVTYRIEMAGEQRCLVRRQVLLVEGTHGMRRDVVCWGVERFTLEREASGRPVAGAAELPPADTAWRLRVWTDRSAEPLEHRFQGGML